MSLDTIAKEDLWMAVNDLRNAALVVEYAGHHKGSMVQGRTGAVCAMAAVEIATYRPLNFIDGLRLFTMGSGVPMDFRTRNALRVLVNFLPTELCERCDYSDDGGLDADDIAGGKVVHYNDYHCPGATVLVNMMHLAADEAVNVLADQRRLLTGPPILVPA